MGRLVMIYFEDQVFEFQEIKKKILEDNISEKEKYFIIEALSTVFFEDDGTTVTSDSLEIVLINDSYSSIMGLESKKLIGRITTDLVNEGVFQRSVAAMALKDKEQKIIIQNQENGKTVMNTAKPIFNENGEVERIITTIRDIPVLKELYEDLLTQKTLLEDYKQTLNVNNKLETGEIIARSSKMRDVVDFAEKVAISDSSVLILGESGVGKGVVADLIHGLSRRSENHKVSINCGAIPEQLLESELFGYTKGAFTGANKEGKIGLIEAASGGTIILDEIGEMPILLQPKLLAFLETGIINKVGSTESKQLDSRVIAITNKDLEKAVKEGKFREDLYYRLNVIPVEVPSLRERKEDIIPLIILFLEKFNKRNGFNKTIAPEILLKMQSYDWPGNIRELRNMIERLVVLSMGSEITEKDLRKTELKNETYNFQEDVNWPIELVKLTKDLEDYYIEKAMAKGGSIREAAKLLRISPSMMYRKINR